MKTAITRPSLRLENVLDVLAPAVAGISAFFSWIMLINSLRVPFYLYFQRTVYMIYVDRLVDPIIWLASSASALVLVAAGARERPFWLWFSTILLWSGIALGSLTTFSMKMGWLSLLAPFLTLTGCIASSQTTRHRTRSAVILVLVLSMLILPAELGSLLHYVLSAVQPGISIGSAWELFELQFWYTAAPLIPFLYVVFLFSWIWTPFVARLFPKSIVGVPIETVGALVRAKESRAWLMAVAGFVLSVSFLGYYPYLHDPSYPLVGTDIYWRNALPAGRVLSSTSWLSAAAKERHPLIVLGIAVASRLSGLGVESLLRFGYVGLILVLGVTVFVLVFVASRSKGMASMSAMMSAVSVSTTVGMYTGIVANWTALIVWVLTLVFLAFPRSRVLPGGFISVLGLGIGSLAVLFIHPWTWIATMVGLVAYCAIVLSARPKGYLREVGSIIFVIFFSAGVLALSLLLLWKAQGWRLAEAFSLVGNALASKYFGFGSWEILVFLSQIWSQFLHPVLLALSILGVIVLARMRNRLSWILFAWLVAACATNLLAAPMGYNPLDINRGETQIFRAVFLTPFQVPAAVGLLSLKSYLESKMGRSRGSRIVVGVIVGSVLLAIVNGTFRAVFTLLTDPHNYPNPLAP